MLEAVTQRWYNLTQWELMPVFDGHIFKLCDFVAQFHPETKLPHFKDPNEPWTE